MTHSVPILALAFACLFGQATFAETGAGQETLAELLAGEQIDFQVPHSEDLGSPITNGDVLDTPETRIIATYAANGGRLYVFRRSKAQGSWRGAEVRWPEASETACKGGSITDIAVANGTIYLTGHINPSAACTLVLAETLEAQDTLYGWPVAQFQDGRIVYQHSEIHFAPTHYAELSIYDPVKRQHHQLYPPKPETPLRRHYLERVRAAYARCCVDHPPAACGSEFSNHNHPCNPEFFESSLGEVVVDDATDSLTFRVRYEDIVGTEDVMYVVRHLREAPEVRETAAAGQRPP
ncbi:MAG TPA: hypothetical protein VGH73_05295 [Thermoanaerobaculia bacterium]|jgi:hypothetical protein